MSIINPNGDYQSQYKTTVVTTNGTYTESKFKNKLDETNFHKFLKAESLRIYNLKLSENKGKSLEDIKNEVFQIHFPRWEQK